MDAKTTVAAALAMARARLKEIPSFGLYASCVAQLEYLSLVLSGDEKIDRPKLRTIIVGHYGLREFEESDPEFSKVLKDAQVIASRMAEGLKIDNG